MIKCEYFKCDNPAVTFWMDPINKHSKAYCEHHCRYLGMATNYKDFEVSKEEFEVARVMFE